MTKEEIRREFFGRKRKGKHVYDHRRNKNGKAFCVLYTHPYPDDDVEEIHIYGSEKVMRRNWEEKFYQGMNFGYDMQIDDFVDL